MQLGCDIVLNGKINCFDFYLLEEFNIHIHGQWYVAHPLRSIRYHTNYEFNEKRSEHCVN